MDGPFSGLIYNCPMKLRQSLALAFTFLLFACQTTTSPSTVTIIDSEKILTLQTEERVPSAILAQAGINLNPKDEVLSNGIPIALDERISQSPVSSQPAVLQIRRAANLLLITPQGQQAIQTSAFTVGEALTEAGITLHPNDKIEPPLNSPIANPLTISYIPAGELTVNVDGKQLHVYSSAATVGEALAEAGMPLLGLDYSLPADNEALPADGQIKVVRVNESVLLAQKPIPFESESQASAEVPLDQTQILQPGENGLTVQRIRIRYEDGKEISRVTEDKTTIRPPKTRIVGYGTKVEIKTTTVAGVKIEYWRAVQMYATSYSPCRSGGDRCYPGTSSGQSLRKGLVGLRYSWYLNMQGQRLFIPGYGFATVADVCGGCTGKPWVDLGYSDNDYEQWNSWVTVYFLTPVPANIIYDLQ